MLSSRHQNVAFPVNTDFTTSTNNHLLKRSEKSVKLASSPRKENVAHPVAINVTGRKKTVVLKTPAAGASHKSIAQTDKGPRQMHRLGALSEKTNGTPFFKKNVPMTPGYTSSKPTKSFKIFDDSITVSAPRISSTRKTLRAPRSASKNFQTPEPVGNHWDVSDVSIDASITEEISIAEHDYGDVEYMPPTAVEPAYDPGFAMPDYKEVGATLLSLFRESHVLDDSEMFGELYRTELLKEIGTPVWETLELADIEEDELLRPTKSDYGKKPDVLKPSPLPLAVKSQEMTSSSSQQHKNSKSLKPVATTFRKSNQPTLSHRTLTATTSTGVKARDVTNTRIPILSKKSTTSQGGGSTTKPTGTKVVKVKTTVPVGISRRQVMPITSAKATSILNRSKPATNVIHHMKSRQKPCLIPEDTVVDLIGTMDEETGDEFLFTL